MDPIFRRSSTYYWTTLGTYAFLMGRFIETRDWTAFEVIPLFMPVWLASALVFSERDEAYAFLRTLPVPDRVVVRTKLGLILLLAAIEWLLLVAVTLFRRGDQVVGPGVLVYVTAICFLGFALVALLQIGIWSRGLARMTGVCVGFILGGIVLVTLHMVALNHIGGWPPLSRLAVVERLGGAPWVSSALVVALTLALFHRLVQVGVRVKHSSEAHL
jgi:hypothetical protein